MIIVDDCIVSDHIALQHFCCDLACCKGACCVEGDAGAPLDAEEVPILEQSYPLFSPFMTDKGRQVVEHFGVATTDSDGSLSTPLVEGRECAFAFVDQGITLCAIEKAFRAGLIDFIKPISCHLYPIRIDDFGEFKALNYHQWTICHDAVRHGTQLKSPLYVVLKEPLIRKFGQDWYDELVAQCLSFLNQQ